jgi:hypothetical protein
MIASLNRRVSFASTMEVREHGCNSVTRLRRLGRRLFSELVIFYHQTANGVSCLNAGVIG